MRNASNWLRKTHYAENISLWDRTLRVRSSFRYNNWPAIPFLSKVSFSSVQISYFAFFLDIFKMRVSNTLDYLSIDLQRFFFCEYSPPLLLWFELSLVSHECSVSIRPTVPGSHPVGPFRREVSPKLPITVVGAVERRHFILVVRHFDHVCFTQSRTREIFLANSATRPIKALGP